MLGWYPGHMHKARSQIKDALPEIDVVIEVLDARLPYSSTNPVLSELTRHKPVLKLLSRADLADPARTREWVEYFDALPNTRALAITTLEARDLKQIPRLCREMAGHIRVDRDARVMVMGIPNVGKSTLINGLAGRKIAKTGNEPAVTKRQQKIRIDGGIALIDTPGVMWPKIEDQASAYRLAGQRRDMLDARPYTLRDGDLRKASWIPSKESPAKFASHTSWTTSAMTFAGRFSNTPSVSRTRAIAFSSSISATRRPSASRHRKRFCRT